MRRTLLTLFSGCALVLHSQPVLNASDFMPMVGPLPATQLVDYLAPSAAGANVSLDASSVQQTAPSQSQVLLPSSTPYGGDYPLATFATTSLFNPTVYGYQHNTNTFTDNLGFRSADASMLLTNGERIMSYPLAYNDQWADAWGGSGSSSGVTFSRSGNTTGHYNGHGTLILPFGTFNDVARLELNQAYTDLIQGFTVETDVNIVNYLKPGYDLVLFSSTTTIIDFGFGNVQETEYSAMIDPSAVGIAEGRDGTVEVMLFPNPASQLATLAFTRLGGAAANVMIYDAVGRLVHTENVAAGQLQTVLDVSGMENGTYAMHIQQGTEAMVMSLVVQH